MVKRTTEKICHKLVYCVTKVTFEAEVSCRLSLEARARVVNKLFACWLHDIMRKALFLKSGVANWVNGPPREFQTTSRTSRKSFGFYRNPGLGPAWALEASILSKPGNNIRYSLIRSSSLDNDPVRLVSESETFREFARKQLSALEPSEASSGSLSPPGPQGMLNLLLFWGKRTNQKV